MRNGIIGAFMLLITLVSGFYAGFKVSDSTYVLVDGDYLTRYEIQAILDEMDKEEEQV